MILIVFHFSFLDFLSLRRRHTVDVDGSAQKSVFYEIFEVGGLKQRAHSLVAAT